CWTPDGSLDGRGRGRGREGGGTGQALRLAVAHDVEVFNLARPDHEQRIRALLLRTAAPEHDETRAAGVLAAANQARAPGRAVTNAPRQAPVARHTGAGRPAARCMERR
ncbi:MAG: hypothetical protein ACRDKY_02480, partial [Solirubrobacteraceae bacterium]